jgi:uncharacterized protein
MRSLLHLCAGMLLVIGPASAVDWKALKPQGYVSDFAGVVDPQSKAALESYCARLEQATGAQLALVTVKSLEGDPIEDATNDLFHAWGVGKKGEDNGAMVLLSVDDRKSRLEVGFGLGGIIPDGMAGLLLDDMRPALRAKQYGQALISAADRLGSTIAQAKGVTLSERLPRQVQRGTRDSIPWPLVLFGIFILIMIVRGGRGNRYRGYGGRGYGGGAGGGFWTGMLLGQLLNGRRGWSGGGRMGGGFGGFDSGGSGGGFGGFDSGGGGGFGGFGGGDSGGGGASSDW